MKNESFRNGYYKDICTEISIYHHDFILLKAYIETIEPFKDLLILILPKRCDNIINFGQD